MVHRCIVCLKSSGTNKDISFHQFPKDLIKRQLWIDALNIKTNVLHWHRICSLHFNQANYTFSDERKKLKLDAIPARHEEEENMSVDQSMSILNDSPISFCSVEINCNNDASNQISINTPTSLDRSPETGNVSSSSYSKKKYLSSSRIGDLDDEDFSTPTRRKRNLIVVKNAVHNLRRKNKLLTQKNGRLEKKINSLNNLIKELKNSCIKPEYAAINHDHDYLNSVQHLNSFTEDVSVYIAGLHVAMKLEKNNCL